MTTPMVAAYRSTACSCVRACRAGLSGGRGRDAPHGIHHRAKLANAVDAYGDIGETLRDADLVVVAGLAATIVAA